MLETSYFY